MSNKMRCPYCGGEDLDYNGVDEGGDYGEQLCDDWYCYDCDHTFEADCIDVSSPWDV